MTQMEYRLDFELKKVTPYPTIQGNIQGVY